MFLYCLSGFLLLHPGLVAVTRDPSLLLSCHANQSPAAPVDGSLRISGAIYSSVPTGEMARSSSTEIARPKSPSCKWPLLEMKRFSSLMSLQSKHRAGRGCVLGCCGGSAWSSHEAPINLRLHVQSKLLLDRAGVLYCS